MRYHHENNLFGRLRRWRRSHRFFFVSLWVVGVLSVAGIIFVVYENSQETPAKQSATVTENISAARNKTVANQYFRFTSSVLWDLDADASNIPNKFVYQHKNRTLTEQVLTIYLDSQPPNDLKVTYILPVSVQDNLIQHKDLSQHCGKDKNFKGNPFVTSFNNVAFTCVPDLNDMIIAAGTIGGSYPINLQGADGNSHKIVAIFQDTTVERHSLLFGELLNTFKLR